MRDYIEWVCETVIPRFEALSHIFHASHITLNVLRGRNNVTIIINNQIQNGGKKRHWHWLVSVKSNEEKSLESMVHLTLLLQQWWRWWWWLRRRRRRQPARDYKDDSCRKNMASRKKFLLWWKFVGLGVIVWGSEVEDGCCCCCCRYHKAFVVKMSALCCASWKIIHKTQ